MPLYEYQCAKCGAVFEVRQKFSDAPITIHEGCGGEVVKLLSAPAFHLKGGGWYVTDYARGGSSAKNEDSKSEASDKGETKTESKPDSKPTETKTDTKTETKSEAKPASTTTTKTE